MNKSYKILIYGASGFTGKLVAESLAERDVAFYMAGRNRAKLEKALSVVQERHGGPVMAEIVIANNTVEELVPLFEKVDVVINVAGPFMQLAWPVIEAALEANCHYIDTTGEQDWTNAINLKYGRAFTDKGLLLCPACAYMWAAGALAAEVVLENEGVDSLDIVYQIDHGLPSEGSTKSFLRMICNDTSQHFLELNELGTWRNDKFYDIAVPYRNATLRAHPWSGGCEPLWYQHDSRVRNCKVLVGIGEHLIDAVAAAIGEFNEQAAHLSQPEREEWTNNFGGQMTSEEPPKDDKDVQRSVIVCKGQGRQVTNEFVLSVSAPYTWTGEMAAEAALRLINNQLKAVGFQSAAKAFGHRELLAAFHERGFCNFPA